MNKSIANELLDFFTSYYKETIIKINCNCPKSINRNNFNHLCSTCQLIKTIELLITKVIGPMQEELNNYIREKIYESLPRLNLNSKFGKILPVNTESQALQLFLMEQKDRYYQPIEENKNDV